MFKQGSGPAGIAIPDYQENFHKHSKTFSFAARFFDQKTANATAQLYYFFRYVDDIIDENKELSVDQKRKEVRSATQAESFKSLQQEYELPLDVIEIFIEGALEDIHLSRIENSEHLMRYCYAVASTVGICMCRLFKVQNPQAYYHAIDLGIAMQLTNICRDVYEDYNNQRIYLSEIKPQHFQNDDGAAIQSVIVEHLKRADQYYNSAYQGLRYLPLRVRFVIFLAAKLYQRIGAHIIKNKNYKCRAATSPWEKILLSGINLLKFIIHQIRPEKKPHQKDLHISIQGLPYANR